ESSGGGAVDAIFNAIEKLINSGTELQVYSVNAVTQGTDTDILVASAKAYLHALTLMREPGSLHPQLGGI
ncbi:2-isopropylmalate synthase, partial [Porticoccaceae bacterium]|nr:2-isopropylmalate synthase [Porticoccaceae bacterium]